MSTTAARADFEVERSDLVSVGPTWEPVTIDEFRTFVRADSTEDAATLAFYLAAARAEVERQTGRAICAQTRILRRRGFPGSRDWIELPSAPLRGVTSITYVDDTTGTATTWAAASYAVKTDTEPGRIYPAHGESWPSNVRDEAASVVITYTAGYGTPELLAARAPTLRMLVLWLASWWYEQRLPVNVGNTVNPLPHHMGAILEGERVVLAYP